MIVVAACAAAGYWYFAQQRAQAARTAQFKADELKRLQQRSYWGDRDLAVAYSQLLGEGKPADAYNVYKDAIAAQTDKAKKISLYTQAVEMAVQKQQLDQALQYARGLSDFDPNYRNSINVADMYKLKKDTVNEKQWVKKALDQLNAQPHDAPDYTTFAPVYQARLADLEKQ